MSYKEIMDKLQEPFPPCDVEWRVGATNQDKTKGIALAYITNRAIMSRLDELFGPFGWKNEFKEWKDSSQICGISIKDPETGDWITKWDGADDSQTEAIKGGLSDAMKRAGYQWGIGRYLYNLDNIWCEIEPCGKSYRLKKEPQLPAWALPGNAPKQVEPVRNQEHIQTVNQQKDESEFCKKLYANASALGWKDRDKIKIIAAEVFEKESVASLKDVLRSQQDVNKLLLELGNRKGQAS